ncbi:MAG TPA: EAL domain-containing protein [Candidatus Competibacter sp.]|nr:EAL domain-containing protein [Candidatus Competibacteraceae bacterium]HPE72358.1 EAL domain-containing protein [Candidatus Competibacter sp.]HRW65971.1 EAL domain-containing protein [Candidatus Competibacter sp.]
MVTRIRAILAALAGFAAVLLAIWGVDHGIVQPAWQISRALIGALGLAALALLLGQVWWFNRARRGETETAVAAWGSAALVVLIGLAVTASLYGDLRQHSQIVLARDFQAIAAMQIDRAIGRFRDNLEDVDTTRRFLEGAGAVDRAQFRAFVMPLLRGGGFQALEWLPRVPREQRVVYEATARRDGLDGFQFTESDPAGRLVPAADRAEYFPVYYLEPLAGNRAALGFAPGPSHPARGMTLVQARDRGQLAATDRYILVQETASEPTYSVLVFAPVYTGAAAMLDVAARREQLRGFALGVVRIGNTFSRALAPTGPAGLQFRLLDLSATADAQVLYALPPAASAAERETPAAFLRQTEEFRFADHIWRLEVTATSAFIDRHRETTYRWIPASGGLLTGLAALYLFGLIARRRRAEALVAARTTELQASEQRFRRVVDQAPFGFHLYRLTDDDQLILDGANPAADAILRFHHADWKGHPMEAIFPTLVPIEIPAIYRRLARQGGAQRWEAVEYRDHRVAGSFEVTAFQTVPNMLAVAFIDITERQRVGAALRESEERLRDVTDNIPCVVYQFYARPNGEQGLYYLSEHARDLFGIDAPLNQMLACFTTQVVPEDRDAFLLSIQQAVVAASPWDFEGRLIKPSGEIMWFKAVSRPRQFAHELVFTGVILDITERKQAEVRIHDLAFFDVLTGLPNRALLAQRAELALALAARSQASLAVLFFDLDRFKEVNDSLGHAEGDTLLRQVAVRLKTLVRVEDTVCRLGGDEFVLLLPQADQAGALRVADKMLVAFRQPFDVAGHALQVTISIGIALYPHDGADFAELLKNADTALYRVKQNGRNARVFYDRAMNEATFERLLLETELRQALASGQLRVYYQPKIRLTDGALVGAEALVRWQHPERGLLPPGLFVPVAEASDLIVALGDWMLDEVCRQLLTWRRAGLAPPPVAINLAARHFRQPGLADRICGLLESCELSPQALELELTESTLLEVGEDTIETLRQLQRLGMALALDDFGAGYCNLGYLKHLPIATLKIDRSFVRDLVIDSDDRVLSATIVALGHHLGLAVVAEGVETEEQRRILLEQGCDLAQGYLFDRPGPAETFAAWLAPTRAQPG